MKTREEKIKAIIDKFNIPEDEATIIMLERDKAELQQRLKDLDRQTEEVINEHKRDKAELQQRLKDLDRQTKEVLNEHKKNLLQIGFIRKHGLPKNDYESHLFSLGLDKDEVENLIK